MNPKTVLIYKPKIQGSVSLLHDSRKPSSKRSFSLHSRSVQGQSVRLGPSKNPFFSGGCAAKTWSSVADDCWNVGCGRLGCYHFPYISKGFPHSEIASLSHTSSSSSDPLFTIFFLFLISTFHFLSPLYFNIIIFLGSIWYYSFKEKLASSDPRKLPGSSCCILGDLRNTLRISPYGQWLLTSRETIFGSFCSLIFLQS